MTTIEVGQLGAEFRLKGRGGQWVAVGLSRHAERRSRLLPARVLARVLAPASRICSGTWPRSRAERGRFRRQSSTVTTPNEAFARQLKLDFPLLSDFKRRRCRPTGCCRVRRATAVGANFLIGMDGASPTRTLSDDAANITQVPSPSDCSSVARPAALGPGTGSRARLAGRSYPHPPAVLVVGGGRTRRARSPSAWAARVRGAHRHRHGSGGQRARAADRAGAGERARHPRIDGWGCCARSGAQSRAVLRAALRRRRGRIEPWRDARGRLRRARAPVRLERLIAVLQRGRRAPGADDARRPRWRASSTSGWGSSGSPACRAQSCAWMEQVRTVGRRAPACCWRASPARASGSWRRMIHRSEARAGTSVRMVNFAASGEGALAGDLFGWERARPAPASCAPVAWSWADQGTLFLDEVGGGAAAVQVRCCAGSRPRRSNASAAATRCTPTRGDRLDVARPRARTRAAASRGSVRAPVGGAHRPAPAARAGGGHFRCWSRRSSRNPTASTAAVSPGEPGHRGAIAPCLAGHVRQLRGAIEGMVVAVDRRRTARVDRPAAGAAGRRDRARARRARRMDRGGGERQLIEATLRHTGGDKPRAAAILGGGSGRCTAS